MRREIRPVPLDTPLPSFHAGPPDRFALAG